MSGPGPGGVFVPALPLSGAACGSLNIFVRICIMGVVKNFRQYQPDLAGHNMEVNIHGNIEELRHEIAELKRSKEELSESIDKYRTLIESTDDSIYLIDKSSRYLFMNKKHLSRMELDVKEVLGKTYGDFHSKEETGMFLEQIEKVLKTGESAQFEHKSVRDGGYFLRTMSPVMDASNSIKAVTVISKNITPLKNLEAELYALSLSDELTSLYNRRGFMTLAGQQLKISKRMKRHMLLIFADMDHMKVINDSYGHSQGDKALKDLGEILRNTFRESDIIARIGGDEFVILITAFQNGAENLYLGRLCNNIEKFNGSKIRPYTISVSIGMVVSDPFESYSVEVLLEHADRRMYERKISGQKSNP
jgi:diguanylate cyclase (GGDEF)-like protein/PAS domain S-box-containing protein